jgi:hypothetical protein
VFAETLTGAEARAFRACLGGHPIVLWDNFPVNDTVLSSNLHLGPLAGRDAELTRAVRGHLLNPMTQAHASLVALGTAAAYFQTPRTYDPEVAWRTTLAELDPSGGLAILAEQNRSSPLDLDDARPYAAAIAGVAATYATAAWKPALAALEAEIARQRHGVAAIGRNLGGTPLGDEIAPWVAELAAHVSAALGASALLEAMKPRLVEVRSTVADRSLRVTGLAAPPDETAITALAPRFATVPPLPTFGELVACKGDLLSADVALCPELGLNVHGKALYAVPYSLTDVRTITGRNVHRRLLEFVAERYADYASRRGPGANALTLTIDGAPVPLAPDGAFDVTIAASAGGTATLFLSTAGGDATSRSVP